jgi:hypothetical protein
MREDTEWVIDAEELKAWEAEGEEIKRALDPLLARWWEILAKYEEIRERGLTRNPGEGLRLAIITPDEEKELATLNSEAESVCQAIGFWMNRLTDHVARFPRPKPRPRKRRP